MVGKHVHFVHMQCSTSQGNAEPTAPSGSIGMDDREYFSRIFQSENSSESRELSHTKEKVMQKMHELQTMVKDCEDEDALQGALGHLKAAIAIMTALEKNVHAQHRLPIKRYFGPNKNLEKQLCFFWTKKRRITESRWTKPSMEETIAYRKQLSTIEPMLCSACLKENDMGTNDTINWIECSRCSTEEYCPFCQ